VGCDRKGRRRDVPRELVARVLSDFPEGVVRNDAQKGRRGALCSYYSGDKETKVYGMKKTEKKTEKWNGDWGLGYQKPTKPSGL